MKRLISQMLPNTNFFFGGGRLSQWNRALSITLFFFISFQIISNQHGIVRLSPDKSACNHPCVDITSQGRHPKPDCHYCVFYHRLHPNYLHCSGSGLFESKFLVF